MPFNKIHLIGQSRCGKGKLMWYTCLFIRCNQTALYGKTFGNSLNPKGSDSRTTFTSRILTAHNGFS